MSEFVICINNARNPASLIVLADRKPLRARFLILGSASPELLGQSSETLAGRLETVVLEGFRLLSCGGGQFCVLHLPPNLLS